MPTILVTGGTGNIGGRVVRELRAAGCATVRVLTRQAHAPAEGIEFVTGDLTTGAGLDAAVAGAEIIVHCAGSTSQGDAVMAEHLVEAASRAGARHVVSISVVGVDRMPMASRVDRTLFGYFAAKLAAERRVADSGLGWTTLRATQVHDLIWLAVQQMARLPLIPLPSGIQVQPVEAGEVAARLAELAVGAPAGLVPDIAGPKVYPAAELLSGYLRAIHRRRPIIPVWLPGQAARSFRAGANLSPGRAVGRRTWEEFLAERLGATA